MKRALVVLKISAVVLFLVVCLAVFLALYLSIFGGLFWAIWSADGGDEMVLPMQIFFTGLISFIALVILFGCIGLVMDL